MWDFIQSITSPEQILHIGGLALVLIILFAENGIIIGFFLPGDSLLFFTGLITSTQPELLDTSIYSLLAYMSIASLAGCLFGYYFGWKVGPAVFNRKDSFFFKKKYVDATRTFYERHGGKTLILGKFLPYIRTFAPILAGVIRVPFKSFVAYNVFGAVAWVVSLTLMGYFLGEKFPGIKDYLEYIILGFIVVTNGFVIRAYLKERRKTKAKESEVID
jgi:membrane-associated protein